MRKWVAVLIVAAGLLAAGCGAKYYEAIPVSQHGDGGRHGHKVTCFAVEWHEDGFLTNSYWGVGTFCKVHPERLTPDPPR
jgi:hypothetical protein